jgi:hypothetical protein
MTLYRMPLKTPQNWDGFQIMNQGLTQSAIDYRFNMEWEVLKSAQKQGMELSASPTLADVLRIAGSHATLWVGPHKGIIAPMDRQPTGWTYPSGREYEPENFWQWVPDEVAEAQLVHDSNRFSEDPIQVIFGENSSVFKSIVPAQLDRKHGQILSIEGIPIQRLAGLVKKDVDWVFEFEKQP